MTKKAVVLFSGGLDSSVCLALALHRGYEVHALSVDYGQRHQAELVAAFVLARDHFEVPHTLARLPIEDFTRSALIDGGAPQGRTIDEIGEGGVPSTYVPGRNLILLSVATSFAESIEAEAIFIGCNIVDYPGYPDCRPEFLSAFAEAIKHGTEAGDIYIEAPLLFDSKERIVKRAEALGVPIKDTLSCYQPNSITAEPCGKCDACVIRQEAGA